MELFAYKKKSSFLITYPQPTLIQVTETRSPSDLLNTKLSMSFQHLILFERVKKGLGLGKHM